MKKEIKFKAILLAAGFGTRLRPFTNSKPKCLMEINGLPLIEYWLKNLEKFHCDAVLINTHYLSEQVLSYLKKRKKSKMKIFTKYEKELLGTGGTLKNNMSFLKDSIGLLIHADNYTNLNLESLISDHISKKNSIITMVTFISENPKECGIVEVDNNNLLIDFEEKPSNPKSALANGAIYVFDERFLRKFDKLKKFSDFSKDVILNFKGQIHTWFTNDVLIDIGNPRALEKARKKILDI